MDICELKDFVNSMVPDHESEMGTRRIGCWFYTEDAECLPGHDFNKDIIHPGHNEVYPHGVVGIRADDNFWVVASLPYGFVNLSIEEIVSVLWPEIDEPSFGPDYEEECA